MSEEKSKAFESFYRVTRIIEEHPEYTQRRIAKELGCSVGKVNYILTALVKKGMIKLQRFIKSTDKAGYRYVLTPKGLQEKIKITRQFIKKKLEEYNRIKNELADAKKSLDNTLK